MIINRKKIWELSWPIILANFSIPLVGLVDTLIMGHMPSSDYLAAVALGGIIFNFMYAGLNFLRMGTTGIIAQYHGQKNTEEIFLGLLRPIIIAIIIGITLYICKNIIFEISNYLILGLAAILSAIAGSFIGFKSLKKITLNFIRNLVAIMILLIAFLLLLGIL